MYCDNVFHTKDKRQKYCDRSCANKGRVSNKVTVQCTNCGVNVQRYPSQVSNTPFCTKVCHNEYVEQKHSVRLRCEICNKKFRRKRSHYERDGRNYCSYECSDEGFSRYYSGEDHPGYLNTHTNCSYCDKEIYRKRVLILRQESFFCSIECEGKWKSENMRGENSPRYNPNLTEEERVRERLIPEYYYWRLSVFERDNFTCQLCGDDKGGNLNAHHLNSYKWDVDNRTNVDNGITLCEKCHIEYHSVYGRGNNTKEEFEEYVRSKQKTL